MLLALVLELCCSDVLICLSVKLSLVLHLFLLRRKVFDVVHLSPEHGVVNFCKCLSTLLSCSDQDSAVGHIDTKTST